MAKNFDHHPRPIVPNNLTQLTIETLPFDAVHYVDPGERDEYEDPTVFVDPNGRLRMDKYHQIDPLSHGGLSRRIGRVGVFRSFVFVGASDIKELYLADLRALGDHSLADYRDLNDPMTEQEEFFGNMDLIETSVKFDGFITFEGIRKKKPKLAIYGNEIIRPVFETMLENEKKAIKEAERAKAARKDQAKKQKVSTKK